jgi:glycosyltransferase involved in cell wall biosynthesis
MAMKPAITPHSEINWRGAPQLRTQAAPAIRLEQPPRVLVCGAHQGIGSSPRWRQAWQALTSRACPVQRCPEIPPGGLAGIDVVILQHPQAAPALLARLSADPQAAPALALDLEMDPALMSADHPLYPVLGLDTLDRMEAYQQALRLADRIVVSSPAAAERLAQRHPAVQVIPDGWAPQDAAAGPAALRYTINIGWIGGYSAAQDLASIRRIIMRLLSEFPNTLFVVHGEPQAARMFEDVPQRRWMYLPPAPDEDWSYLLSQMDILVAPLRATPFNDTLADRLLLEAGLRHIPWVASPAPAYQAWAAGGVLASNPEAWHTALRELVQHAELRRMLGEMGWRKAQQRRIDLLAASWMDLVEQAVAAKTKAWRG